MTAEDSQNFVDWSSAKPQEVRPGEFVWTMTGQRLQMIRTEVKPGNPPSYHEHPHEQIIVVLQGAFDFTVGDRREVVRSGGVIHVPSGVHHGGGAYGEETLITMEAFAPPRRDFAFDAGAVDYSHPS